MRRAIRHGLEAVLIAASLALALVGAELLLRAESLSFMPLTSNGYVDVAGLARRAALAHGRSYDTRSTYRVVADRRAAGVRAFPTVSPAWYLDAQQGSRVRVHGQAVLPLGIAASAENYYCNESGSYADFSTDAHGFRNPEQAWQMPVELLAVGDSFTLGACLDAADSIVGRLRALGNTINLGMGGNGPLMELAGLREFAPSLKPKRVLWLFFPNDFDDLERDKRNAILRQYLKSDFSQHLASEGAEFYAAIDAAVETYQTRLQAVEQAKGRRREAPFYRLPHVLRLLAFVKNLHTERSSAQARDTALLMQVLALAKQQAEQVGARFYFVYLPDCTPTSYRQAEWKNALLDELRRAAIEVIDTEPAIARLLSQGQDAYFYCPASHFAPAGARAAAASIAAALAADDSNSTSR